MSATLIAVALFGRISFTATNVKAEDESRHWTKVSIDRFMDMELELEVLGKFDVPIGTIYEVATEDRDSFFHVLKGSKEVIYADIGGMKMRPAKNGMLTRDDALEIATDYVDAQKIDLNGFILPDEQAEFFWPKPTYWTIVWYASPESPYEFAKVTVDAKNGKVVAYGKGNDDWSTFCLPDEAQAAWAEDQKI